MTDLIKELIEAGIAEEDDIVFATKDGTGQVVWLGKGSANAGLKHIIERHMNDFAKALDLTEDTLPGFLEKVISEGKVITNVTSRIGTGYDRVYDYEGNYYTVAGIGSNGFIVTAFPQGKEE